MNSQCELSESSNLDDQCDDSKHADEVLTEQCLDSDGNLIFLDDSDEKLNYGNDSVESVVIDVDGDNDVENDLKEDEICAKQQSDKLAANNVAPQYRFSNKGM